MTKMSFAPTSSPFEGIWTQPESCCVESRRTSAGPLDRVRSWLAGRIVAEPRDEDAADMISLCGGDDEAFDRIVHRWTPRLRSFLVRMTGSEAEACDLVQETFLRVHRYRRNYKPEKPFSTWIFQISANLARNRMRYHGRRPADATCPSRLAAMELESEELQPGHFLESAERAQAVREAILKLPPMARETLILSVYEDLPHGEIARIMKTTEKAVELRLYRARQLLKVELAELV